MQDQELPEGAITWWNGSEFYDRSKLFVELQSLNLEGWIPEFSTPDKLAHIALTKVFGGPATIIRKMDGGWTVHNEIKGQTKNMYPHLMSVRVTKDADKVTLEYSPMDDRSDAITVMYNECRNYITGDSVTGMVTRMLAAWNCRSLRDRGGIYYVVPRMVERWKEVGRCIEKSAVSGNAKVFVSKRRPDKDTIRALRDTIQSEAKEFADKTMEEIDVAMSGKGLGSRGLTNRIELAREMRAQIKEYEDLLGEAMSDVKDSLDEVEAAGAKAMILKGSVPS